MPRIGVGVEEGIPASLLWEINLSTDWPPPKKTNSIYNTSHHSASSIPMWFKTDESKTKVLECSF